MKKTKQILKGLIVSVTKREWAPMTTRAPDPVLRAGGGGTGCDGPEEISKEVNKVRWL